MPEIPLTQNRTALVDTQDIDLADKKWCVLHAGDQFQYAARYLRRCNGKRPIMLMHRVILSRKIGRDLAECELCDHINHDGMDNRRANLRLATRRENGQNQLVVSRPKTSRYKGVSWDKSSRKWRADIRIDGKATHCGRFINESDAARAYDQFAIKYFGSFSITNSIIAGE